MNRSFLALTAAFTVTAGSALAHTGAAAVPAAGFFAGFGHSLDGLDHLLAMVAVGVLAAQQGGKAIWALPAAFVGAMLFAGALAVAGVALPFVEPGIIGSVILLGAVVALGRQLPLGIAAGFVAVLAVFHGHAHGSEMPLAASGLAYGAGFAMATALLHAGGIAIVVSVRRAGRNLAPLALRLGGGVIALAGLGLMAQ